MNINIKNVFAHESWAHRSLNQAKKKYQNSGNFLFKMERKKLKNLQKIYLTPL